MCHPQSYGQSCKACQVRKWLDVQRISGLPYRHSLARRPGSVFRWPPAGICPVRFIEHEDRIQGLDAPLALIKCLDNEDFGGWGVGGGCWALWKGWDNLCTRGKPSGYAYAMKSCSRRQTSVLWTFLPKSYSSIKTHINPSEPEAQLVAEAIAAFLQNSGNAKRLNDLFLEPLEMQVIPGTIVGTFPRYYKIKVSQIRPVYWNAACRLSPHTLSTEASQWRNETGPLDNRKLVLRYYGLQEIVYPILGTLVWLFRLLRRVGKSFFFRCTELKLAREHLIRIKLLFRLPPQAPWSPCVLGQLDLRCRNQSTF